MAYLHKKLMKTFMVFIVFFSAIAPVYGSTITPALKSIALGLQTKSTSMTMPCHKTGSGEAGKIKNHKQTTDQSACFKHCLQYLNDPCLVSLKLDEQLKSNKQTSQEYFITEIQEITSLNLAGLSNKDPPQRILTSAPQKGLSPLLLKTSRFRQ